jgi:hypothetical protein
MLSGFYKKAALASLTRTAHHGAFGASRGFAKEIKFGVEGRAAMLKGVDMLADAVQVCIKIACWDLSMTRAVVISFVYLTVHCCKTPTSFFDHNF